MQKSIIKNMIIATLPVIAYVIADSFFENPVISLCIAIGISLTEFVISFIVYKKIDLFIFFDLLLISAMGGISIMLNDPVFFKLKPAIIEMILILFFIPLCVSPDFFKGYLNRYLKGMNIPMDKMKIIQKKMVLIIPVFLIHVAMIVISAFYFSKEIWVFVSSILLYIVFGLIVAVMFAYKYISNFLYMKRYEDEEWFDVVDEEGRVTSRAPRSVCHNGSKLLHPVVHVHILNSKNKLMLQKRSASKDIQPGKWDTSVGGHIASGEKLDIAIVREAKEEAGIDIDIKKLMPLAKYVFESDIEKELVFSFVCFTDDKIKHDQVEIDEIRFFTMNEIRREISGNTTTPNFATEFNLLESAVKRGLIKIK